MPIKLHYRAETAIPVEVEGLTPDWACDKSLAEIERFEIFHGNQKLPLAELFAVSGDASDKRIDFTGNLAGVHWIGAHMRTGAIHVHGPAGRHVGSELRGGEIHVEGDCGGWLGCEMRGGAIHVRGNAENLVGASYRGSLKGMTGGTIHVDGNAGHEVGISMYGGTILIGGSVGEMLGFNMAGGSLIVLGDAGARVGAGMRAGAIAVLGAKRHAMLSSFRQDRTTDSEAIAAIFRALNEASPSDQSFAPQLPDQIDVFIGDLVEDGNGQVYLRH